MICDPKLEQHANKSSVSDVLARLCKPTAMKNDFTHPQIWHDVSAGGIINIKLDFKEILLEEMRI